MTAIVLISLTILVTLLLVGYVRVIRCIGNIDDIFRYSLFGKLKVKVINTSGNDLPKYQTEGSAGIDLQASIGEPVVLAKGETKYVPTGLCMSIPKGFEAQIRQRSGLTLHEGIVSQLGTIDSDYRGEIGLIVTNIGSKDFTIINGMRLAQMVFAPVKQVVFNLVDKLDETERGDGGFGHTGV